MMPRTLSPILALLITFLIAAPLSASQRTIDMLVHGGPESQRQAAQDIYNGIERNPDVYDVLAEVLSRNYQRGGYIQVDATSWMCKALGATGDARYRLLLEQIADKARERKVRRYAETALEMLPTGQAQPYLPGTIDLDKLRQRQVRQEAPPQNPGRIQGGAPPQGQGHFSRIHPGMSMEEVYDLIGHPTSSTSRITGKAWAPFYFGGDTARMFALYKGRGRIVFSNASQFAPVWRVIEVVEDPAESGYP